MWRGAPGSGHSTPKRCRSAHALNEAVDLSFGLRPQFLSQRVIRGDLASKRGYLVIESAPPLFKAWFDCWGDVGPQVEVMAGLKRAFDPWRVLNPGRFVHHL